MKATDSAKALKHEYTWQFQRTERSGEKLFAKIWETSQITWDFMSSSKEVVSNLIWFYFFPNMVASTQHGSQ